MIGGRVIKDTAFNDNVLEDNSFWRYRLHHGDFSATSDWRDQFHRCFLSRGEYDFNADITLSRQTSGNTGRTVSHLFSRMHSRFQLCDTASWLTKPACQNILFNRRKSASCQKLTRFTLATGRSTFVLVWMVPFRVYMCCFHVCSSVRIRLLKSNLFCESRIWPTTDFSRYMLFFVVVAFVLFFNYQAKQHKLSVNAIPVYACACAMCWMLCTLTGQWGHDTHVP